jgi:hypothetical protein
MSTVFSHIVQKRFSQENENIATDALAFVVQSSEAARSGLMKLLRGIASNLPSLQFRTQQSEDGSRPDMWGYDVTTPRVFIENKFWAGLTDNQPAEYLRLLAKYTNPTVLLVVVPAARQETVWRDLLRRLSATNISTPSREPSAGTYRIVETDLGLVLALTSWAKLLSAIEAELIDEPQPMNDLNQLRALCDAADSDAFVPLSSTELTDQRTAAFILQLNTIVQQAVELGITQGFLSVDHLRPMSSWEQIGRYISFPAASGVGAWIGTDFRRWKQHGRTPLWLKFLAGKWGRALEVRALLEPWADREGIAYATDNEEMAVGIDLATGEEIDLTVKSVVDLLRNISAELSGLPQFQG